VDVRLRPPDQAAARGRGLQYRSPGGGLATLVKRRNNSKEYDVFTTGIGAAYDPTHHVYLTANWPGWTTDEDIQRIQSELARETDPKKRMALWEQQTRQFYEKVPVIRYGDLFGLRAMRNTVKGSTRRPSASASTTSGSRSNAWGLTSSDGSWPSCP